MPADPFTQSGRYPHAELSGKIIGAAIAVSNALRPGLDEKVYENALVIELRHIGLKVEQQQSFLPSTIPTLLKCWATSPSQA